MCSALVDPADSAAPPSRLRIACEVGLIFLVFFIHAGWPVPDVNEAHYLSKAKHYWDPSWCAGDFLCQTADAHQVFYWTFGWLSRWMPLVAMAWFGRLLTWGLLAWAWRRLSWSLVPAPWYSVLSAALFVTLIHRCEMAGEWVVGGVEAKGFAYVLILLGLEALVRGRWGLGFLLFGAASSFHVVVGGWSVVAAGVAWLTSANRPPPARLILPLIGGLLLALPGLLPALALTWHVDPEVVREANRIYVYERLWHHLLPQRFPWEFLGRQFLLVLALVVLVRGSGADQRLARLRGFVAATVGIAAIGMVIALFAPAQPDVAASLLRFYWFRLSDVMVPLGVALVGSSNLLRWQTTKPRWHLVGLMVAIIVAGDDLGKTILRRHENPRAPADTGVVNPEAWRELCQWIADETPPDAVFLTPRLAQTFRWYSGRAEVVNRKDFPQDAPAIVEWWRRMQRIHRADVGTQNEHWRESLAELGSQKLNELGREFGADYVITSAYPVVNLPRVGPQNPSYAVYRLSPEARDRVDDSELSLPP